MKQPPMQPIYTADGHIRSFPYGLSWYDELMHRVLQKDAFAEAISASFGHTHLHSLSHAANVLDKIRRINEWCKSQGYLPYLREINVRNFPTNQATEKEPTMTTTNANFANLIQTEIAPSTANTGRMVTANTDSIRPGTYVNNLQTRTTNGASITATRMSAESFQVTTSSTTFRAQDLREAAAEFLSLAEHLDGKKGRVVIGDAGGNVSRPSRSRKPVAKKGKK